MKHSEINIISSLFLTEDKNIYVSGESQSVKLDLYDMFMYEKTENVIRRFFILINHVLKTFIKKFISEICWKFSPVSICRNSIIFINAVTAITLSV